MIHHKVWYVLEEINDAIVPGPGQLIGFDIKRDIFTPVDLVPVVGPLGKLYKATKVVKHGPKVKKYVFWGINLAADVFAVKEAVEWYDARYRDVFQDIEEESSPAARRGNAEGPGGGTKKKPRKGSRRLKRTSPKAWKGQRCGKFMGRSHAGGQRIRLRRYYCVLRKGHSGPHRSK